MTGHSFIRKIVGFVYCAKCGLVRLGNAATRRAEREPCGSKGGDK